MKKFLLVHVACFIVFTYIFYSCSSSDTNTKDLVIAGTWHLKQEYSNEGEDTPLKEFPLSDCDKETTLEILISGKFIEKNYYKDSSIAGGCGKDSQDTKGNWKESVEGMYLFMYDISNALALKGSTVTIEKGDLVINSIYNDKDLGRGRQLKFIYSRVK